MKNQKMNELSNEALLKKQKFLKIVIYILSGTLLVLFCVTTISTLMDYFHPLRHDNAPIGTLIVFLPIIIINYRNLNEIKKELKSRSLA